MRNLDELDIVFQKLETLEDQKREAEIAKLRSKITKSYVINTVLAALMYIALVKNDFRDKITTIYFFLSAVFIAGMIA